MTEDLEKNFNEITEILSRGNDRGEKITLLAATKFVDIGRINEAIALGVTAIGENRAQVALPKLAEIAPEFHLHWIGRLQTNKVKYIIDHVCLLHALDRMDLAQEIDRRAGQRGRVLPVLLQINLARESQKGGMPVEEVLPFLRKMRDFSGLHVEGLMSILPQYAEKVEPLCKEDVIDPYGQSDDVYNRTYEQIEAGIKEKMPQWKKENTL